MGGQPCGLLKLAGKMRQAQLRSGGQLDQGEWMFQMRLDIRSDMAQFVGCEPSGRRWLGGHGMGIASKKVHSEGVGQHLGIQSLSGPPCSAGGLQDQPQVVVERITGVKVRDNLDVCGLARRCPSLDQHGRTHGGGFSRTILLLAYPYQSGGDLEVRIMAPAPEPTAIGSTR